MNFQILDDLRNLYCHPVIKIQFSLFFPLSSSLPVYKMIGIIQDRVCEIIYWQGEALFI